MEVFFCDIKMLLDMQKVPFPFRHHCYFRLVNGNTPLTLVEAEEAVTPAEVYQALNYRSRLHFTRPLVLHFENPAVPTPVWLGFAFDVEMLVVDTQGVVQQLVPIPRRRPNDALFVQFFAECSCAILVPAGFGRAWQVVPQQTKVNRIRIAPYVQQTA